MRDNQRIRIGSVALAALVVLLSGGTAGAQDARAVKKVTDMNRMAMEEYDLLEFESAKKKLNEALVTVKRSNLDGHPVAARTHVNLGIVYGGGLGDPDNALLEFMRAVEIDPSIQLDPAYKTPELEKLFDQARAATGAAADGGGGAEPVTEDVTGLVHTVIDEAPAGKPIRVVAKVGADVGARQVVLYFRPQGSESFQPTVMKNTGGVTYEGQIPLVTADSVHYYIEAKNDAGKVAATSGTAGSPNIVLITTGGGGELDERLDDENQLVGGGGGGGGGDEEATMTRTAARGGHKLFVTVAVGTGGSFVTGKTEAQLQPVNCCVAPSPLFVQPEIGFFLSRQTTLSLYGRLGFPLGASVQGAATFGPAGLVRFTHALSARGGGLSFHGDIGGGLIRSTVELNNGQDGMNVDTYAVGPLLVGGGAKWVKPLGGGLRFLADANLLFGVPVVDTLGTSNPEFGVNLDLSIGMALAF